MSMKPLPLVIVLVDELTLLFMEVWTEINGRASSRSEEVRFLEAQTV